MTTKELTIATSTVWVLIAAILVMFMQAGFAFLEAGLIDKLLVFVATVVGSDGRRFLGDLAAGVPLFRLNARPVGEDVLLTAYIHEP